jgi:putative transposase
VDSLGLLLEVVLTAANQSDIAGGHQVLRQAHSHYPRLTQVWADQGYKGLFPAWAWNSLGIDVRLTSKPGFGVPGTLYPKRWVVERTFAWLGRYRRLSKDYEYLTETSRAWIFLAMTRLMLKRLTRDAA